MPEFYDEIEAPRTIVTIDNTDSPYSVLPNDDILEIDSSGGAVVINLQQASAVTSPRLVIKKLYDDNIVIINPYSGEQICGESSLVLYLAGGISIYPHEGQGWCREIDDAADISPTFLRRDVKTITNSDSPYSLQPGDDIIRVDTSGGNVTVNMPEASESVVRTCTVKKVANPGTLYISPYSGEEIEFEGTDNDFSVTVRGTSLKMFASNDKPGWEFE